MKKPQIIKEALRLIREHSKRFDITRIPFDDKKTFHLLQEAQTDGIFQLESSEMKDLLLKLRPTVFEDIIVLISLYRSGPKGSDMFKDFISRKHAKSKMIYYHNLKKWLNPILKDTYGIMVYQEQLLEITRRLAGFSIRQAENLREAIIHWDDNRICYMKGLFLRGACKNGIDYWAAGVIFRKIEYWGDYCFFNMSRAVALRNATFTYQSAYLKANYPLEYARAMKKCKNILVNMREEVKVNDNIEFI